MKTLMIVSGGDAPGINAVLARYTALAAASGDEVVGAIGGFEGTLNGDIVPLTPPALAAWASQPGTYLRTSRVPVSREADAQTRLRDVLARLAIDNIVLFGGDGTLRYIPPLLRDWRVPCIGLPTTIDNDVPGTEQSLGFDSACNFAYQAVDGAIATGQALNGRIFMIETLGGFTGMLALDVAFGAGAHAILVPEYAYDDDWLTQRLLEAVTREGMALLVLSEGVAASRTLADDIAGWTGIRVRDIRLGHAQRGARPSHRDRVLAAYMARIAHAALHDGVPTGVIVVRDQHTLLHEGILTGLPPRRPDRSLYNFINGLKTDEPASN